MANSPVFLSAEWRTLVLLNYEIDPALLRPYLPPGTELDFWQGITYVSVVGFQFLSTRIRGIPIPFHVNFEEVNLRFYVRHQTATGWRRGVVFIKEIVPRSAIAHTARGFYNENYVALPMSHLIRTQGPETTVRYNWKFKGRDNFVEIAVSGAARPIEETSETAFIPEHYGGYTRQRDGGTMEYEVKHPRWQYWPAERSALDCDVAGLYGPGFVPFLQGQPAFAFLADGAPVTISPGRRLDRQLSGRET